VTTQDWLGLSVLLNFTFIAAIAGILRGRWLARPIDEAARHLEIEAAEMRGMARGLEWGRSDNDW
jgi:hypothetical protein